MSSYAIFPSEDRKYIVLKHQGDINSQIAMERVQEAHALGAELGITRYLVDLTEARNVNSISKTYQYAYKDAKTSPEVNQNMRVSMLVNPDDHSHDFVETALRNAGHNVTLFRDRESAIEHLLK
jgi:hypothetical protein